MIEETQFFLFVSTVSPRCGVSLLCKNSDGVAIVDTREWETSRALSKDLFGALGDLRETYPHEFVHLNRIIVHAGPGLFTGTRAGVTVANALSYAYKVPIIGFSGRAEASLGELIKKVIHDESLFSSPLEELHTFVAPQYLSEPHITPKRKNLS